MSDKGPSKVECFYCNNGLIAANQPCPRCGGAGFVPAQSEEETLYLKLKINPELFLENS